MYNSTTNALVMVSELRSKSSLRFSYSMNWNLLEFMYACNCKELMHSSATRVRLTTMATKLRGTGQVQHLSRLVLLRELRINRYKNLMAAVHAARYICIII